jgi:fumarate reductase subunit C
MAEQVGRRPYQRVLPRTGWFLRHPRYVRYMLREVSCIFIGAYTLLVLIGVFRLSQGQAQYEAFLEALRSPLSIVLHVLTLGFAVYHSITWFNLTPRALPIQIGESFVPDAVIAGAHYLAWFVFSLVVLYLAGAF